MIVEVSWKDSFGTVGWDFEDVGVTSIKTVGYLHKRRRDRYVLARGASDSGPEGLFAVPRGCIEDVRILEL